MSTIIPDGWLDYESMGTRIPDTHFIAFKTPLKKMITNKLPTEKQFTPHDLMNKLPNLSLVIDLAYTDRYYDIKVFQENNIEHFKIKCPGHIIPRKDLLKKFFNIVDQFLLKNSRNESALIGVHCTHGINRTGYFICCYMINKLGYNSERAISEFNLARGHGIKRQNYLKSLKKFDKHPITFHEKRNNEEHRKNRNRREYKNYVQRPQYQPSNRRIDSRPPYQNGYGSRNAHSYAWNRRGRQDYDDQFWRD